MIYFDTFAFYTLFCSAVLIYGIGINKIADFQSDVKQNLTLIIKMVVSILLTSILSWVVIITILMPLKLTELYPVTSLLIFICINVFLEAIVRITTGRQSSEFIVSYLIVLISLAESTSLINTIIICISCFLSFILLWPFIVTFKNKLASNGQRLNETYYSYFFFFLAILILCISVFDISWLNSGVIL